MTEDTTPWFVPRGNTQLPARRLNVPTEAIAQWLEPDETPVFASAHPIRHDVVDRGIDMAALREAGLKDSFGLGSGPMHQMAVLARSRRQRVATRLDWLILTDRRLLLVARRTPVTAYSLDPDYLNKRLAAWGQQKKERAAQRAEARQRLGFFGSLLASFFAGFVPRQGAAAAIETYHFSAVVGVDKTSHMFDRGRSVIVRSVLISYGANPGSLATMARNPKGHTELQLASREEADAFIYAISSAASVMAKALADQAG